MKAPDWWWHQRPTVAAHLLAPLGAAYGAVTARRMARSGTRADVPVICVGNLVAGGAGKTPTAIAVARVLTAQGARPAILSRGYGRRASARAAVIPVDPARHGPDAVGDEPLLLAEAAPTYVSGDRVAAARAAIRAGATVLILDDGLQNPALHKSWTLAVVDGAVGFGNGLCLPAGPLRAPAGRQWPHVSAVCLIGEGEAGSRAAALAVAAGKPVHRARLVPDPAALATLRGCPLLAFAGIGRPEKFADTLRAAGLDLMGLRPFPDHHPYRAAERDALLREAQAGGALLVTTAKDRARLPAHYPVLTLPVTLVFDAPERIAAALPR